MSNMSSNALVREQPRSRRAVLILCIAVIAAFLGIPERAAVASPLSRLDAAVRVSAGMGMLEERTYAYPGVDLVGTLRFGASMRGFVDLQLGYVPLDSHTYLADGRMMRAAMAGGTRLLTSGALRLGGVFALETITFHADPDVLTEHPGVDILVSRSRVVPALGLEMSYDVSASLAVGAFSRVDLAEVVLFREGDMDPQASGEEERARLVLFGLFAEVRIR